MKRKFITNLALLVLLNVLVKPFWIFGIDLTVQNTVGAGEYGFYFSLFNFSVILNILLDVGISNFNSRNIAQNEKLVAKHFPHIAALKLCLGLVYFALVLLAALSLSYSERQLWMLGLLALNQFFASLTLYLRSNLAGMHLFRTDSLVSVLDRFLMIIFCAALLWGGITDSPFQIEWFVYAQSLGYLISMLVVLLVVLTKAGRLNFKFDPAFFLAILKQSYPFALLILLMNSYTRVDAVMLERMLPFGKTEAGIYAQSFRILDAASMFAFLFAGLLLPIFSRMLKNNDDFRPMLRISGVLLFVPALIFALLSFAFREDIIDLLYHEHVSYSSGIFGLIILSFIPMSMTHIFGTLLTARGNLRILNNLALGSVALNILLNYFLIPAYGAKGSAIATLITQSLASLAQVAFTLHLTNARLHMGLLIKLALLSLFIIFGSYGTGYLNVIWYYQYLGLAIISGLFAIGLKIINLRSAIRLLTDKTKN